MTKIFKIFADHPASVGESYFEHMAMAFGFGSKMLIGGVACLFVTRIISIFVLKDWQYCGKLTARTNGDSSRQTVCNRMF